MPISNTKGKLTHEWRKETYPTKTDELTNEMSTITNKI